MRRHLTLVLLGITFGSFNSGAQSSFSGDNFRDIRWLGRGNTGVATINDATAVFYNPGGIPLATSYRLQILNPALGANQNLYTGLNAITDVGTGGSNTGIASKFSPFLGKPLSVEASVFPSLSIPGFVAGVWDYVDSGIQYRNPVNPELDLAYRNDYGIIVGSGVKLAKGLGVGASMRYQRRKFVDTTVTGGLVLAGNTSALSNLIESGEGWGLNLGTQYHHEINSYNWFAVGLAAEDVGYTRFVNQHLGEQAPKPQRTQLNSGLAYGFTSQLADLSFRFDMRQLSNTEMSYTKRIYMGTEINLPLIDLRGGFFQGYWTAGFSFKALGAFDIDFATYGKELDSAAGIRESRVWMVGISTGIEFKKTSKRKQRFTLEGL